MLLKDATNRLREHSGLSMPTAFTAGITFIDSIQALQKNERDSVLDESVLDVLKCLECLNQSNCAIPNDRNQILNVDVVYAISGMILSATEASIVLCKKGRECRKLLMATWKIACAWDAVLAGDIEGIEQHLEYESIAKNIDEN